jgi:hypothetical protein
MAQRWIRLGKYLQELWSFERPMTYVDIALSNDGWRGDPYHPKMMQQHTRWSQLFTGGK